MTPHLVPCASGESLSQETLARHAWWQDAQFVPRQPNLAEPMSPESSTDGFVHEKWWLDDAAECAEPDPGK